MDFPSQDARIRCLIVDDSRPFLDAARLLLERQGMAVVGVATTSADALRLEDELRPDVVLVDMRMPGLGGPPMLTRLREELPETRVLVVTASEKAETLLEAVAAGAAGYLT